MSTPVPVQVTNWQPEDTRVLVWAIIAGVAGIVATLAGIGAAVAALWDMAISLKTLARKSSLRARIDYATSDWQWCSGGEYIYKVGCTVANSGDKGLSDFRVTFYFSSGCRITRVDINPSVTGGPHQIDGSTWLAAEINAGRIYADDEVFVGNVIIQALPGDYKVRWVIKSEDERVPKHGYEKPVNLHLPAKPP